MAIRNPLKKAVDTFKSHHGLLRTSQALALGIHPETLYALRDKGTIIPLSRGLYRLADYPELANPDLTIVSRRISQAVICLVSALSIHELTTQVPHRVDIALPRGKAMTPRLKYPPLRVFRFNAASFDRGVEIHEMDGTKVKVYSAARTVADCFKFRGRIGVAIAVEALRRCIEKRAATVSEILSFARLLRVEKVMMPYLEAMQ